jgi:hypothetical protein
VETPFRLRVGVTTIILCYVCKKVNGTLVMNLLELGFVAVITAQPTAYVPQNPRKA